MRINGHIGYTVICLLVVLACGFVMNGCSPKARQVLQRQGETQFIIKNKGSDTIVNLAQAWAEKYTDVSTTASVEVSGGGSGTGVAALINGTVDIANCSRQIRPKELELATQNTGKVPQELSSATMPSPSMCITIHLSIKLRLRNSQKFMVRTAQ